MMTIVREERLIREQGERLASWLWESRDRFRSLVIDHVASSVDQDSTDEIAIFLLVVLAGPVDRDTWDIEDTNALRRAVRLHSQEQDVDCQVYVRLNAVADGV